MPASQTLTLPGETGGHISIGWTLEEHDPANGTVLVWVSFSFPGFEVAVDAWVHTGAWRAFTAAIRRLEATRTGTAQIMSMLPGELSLTFAPAGSRGALMVSGTLGVSDSPDRSLKFQDFVLDAEFLQRELRKLP